MGKGPARIRPGGSFEGIQLEDCTDVTVRNLSFEGGDLAVITSGGARITIDRCRTEDNNDAGFVVIGTTDATVPRCRVDDCGGPAIVFGGDALDEGVLGGSIERCAVRRCEDAGYIVIGDGIAVTRCTADVTGDHGLLLGGAEPFSTQHVDVVKCRVRRSARGGIVCDGGGITVVRSRADLVVGAGLEKHGVATTFERCATRRCGTGVLFEGPELCSVVRCKLVASTADGIAFVATLQCRAESCVVVHSGGDGIWLDPVAEENTVVDNRVSHSGGVDLREEGGGNGNTIEGNRARTRSTDPRP